MPPVHSFPNPDLGKEGAKAVKVEVFYAAFPLHLQNEIWEEM